MATTLTVVGASDQTALQNWTGARNRFAGQAGAGFQNLGTIDKITGGSVDESKQTHSRQQILYDPVGDIIYAVAIS